MNASRILTIFFIAAPLRRACKNMVLTSDLKVSAGTDVAFATALLECAGTEDGKTVAFTLRLTIGLEKHDGNWTVVHEHHSQPLDFDTARIGAGSS
jgi:ketosteroid isomerase-like protein